MFLGVSKVVSSVNQVCSSVFQSHFIGVLRVFQGCLPGVSMVYHGCLKGVSSSIQLGSNGDRMAFYWCLKGIPKVFKRCNRVF